MRPLDNASDEASYTRRSNWESPILGWSGMCDCADASKQFNENHEQVSGQRCTERSAAAPRATTESGGTAHKPPNRGLGSLALGSTRVHD